MDYPHPIVKLNDDGKMDMLDAYAVGIGDWDKRTIIYGYQDFPDGTDEAVALKKEIDQSISDGYLFISDSDARPAGGAHPYGHLWDNGKSPTTELKRLSNLRQKAMQNFGEASITTGTPYSHLENVLVPIYLAHRYQVEGVAKLIGGVNYTYALKGDPHKVLNDMVDPQVQRQALDALLGTLKPEFLEIPERVLKMLPPAAFGYGRNRETFDRYTSTTFDPIAAAEGSANHTLAFLLNKDRLARLVHHHARDSKQLSLGNYLAAISEGVFGNTGSNGIQQQIANTTQRLLVMHLLKQARDTKSFGQLAAEAYQALDQIKSNYLRAENANSRYIEKMISDGIDTSKPLLLPAMPKMPPGSPIGCE